MAQPWVKYDVEGVDTLVKRLNKLSNFDKQDALDQIQAVALNKIRTRFRKEQDPDEKKWPPSAAALIRKAGGYTFSNGKRVTGGGTLFATGKLFHSIQASREDDDTRAVGTDVGYGRVHQFGLLGQEQRRFIGVNSEDERLFVRIVEKKIEGITGG